MLILSIGLTNWVQYARTVRASAMVEAKILDREVTWDEVYEEVLGFVCVHCHMAPESNNGDGGPGNDGGLGFAGVKLDLETYAGVKRGLMRGGKRVSVIKPPAFNRFQNGFGHIFAGGYAAGYYSYKWAEVLSCDAYARFEEEGPFNEATGRDFREKILARGGSREPMELFVDFRGREPSVEPLLRHSGIEG